MDIYLALYTIQVETGIKIMKQIKEFIACVHTLLYLTDVFFSAFKWKYLKAELLNFLKIAIYGTQLYLI